MPAVDTAPDALMIPTASEREDMIAVAAYFLAERRGFVPGRAESDWLRAEVQIDAMIEAMRRQGVTRAQFERAGMRNALRMWSSVRSDD